MAIDYDSIYLVHRIQGCYSDRETHRRLSEIRDCTYHNNARVRSLQKTLGRKSNSMSDYEREVLRDFPQAGMDLENWSNALLFAPGICSIPVRKHKALVALIRLGYLGIVEGYVSGTTIRKQVLARL